MDTPSIAVKDIPVFWYVVATIVASLFGGTTIAAILTAVLNRKKPAAEIHESEARSALTLAKSRSVDVTTNISAGDAVLRMVQQLTFKQMQNEELCKENDRLVSEIETYEAQLRRAKALFRLHQIKFDE